MEDHGLTAHEIPRRGRLLANPARLRQPVPQHIRDAAARIAAPDPVAPTLVVAAFQSSI